MYQTCFTIKEAAPVTYQATGTAAEELPATSFMIVPTIIQEVYDNLVKSLGPEKFAKMQKRIDRGYQLALDGKVTFTDDPNVFKVMGNVKPWYTVDLLARTCDCPDCNNIPANYCKHRVAAYLFSEAVKATPAPEPVVEESIIEEPIVENPEIIDVVNVAYVTMRYHGKPIHLELVETSDGQISTRALLPDSAPIWINSTNHQVIAESLADYGV